MKKLLLSLMLMISVSATFATQPGYEDNMKGLLKKIGNAKTLEAMQVCTNSLIRIADVEKEEWLPLYYTAMTYILQSSMVKEGAEIDAKLDKADEYLKKAMDMVSNDELLCLSSWSKSSRIAVNPMTRGQKYGMESAMVLQRALNLNDKNPRAHYLKGMSNYFTPEEFGGGKRQALSEFQIASELYQSVKPSSEIMPSWGAEENEKMIQRIYAEGGKELSTEDAAKQAKEGTKK